MLQQVANNSRMYGAIITVVWHKSLVLIVHHVWSNWNHYAAWHLGLLICGVSAWAKTLLPAGTPSCRGQRCCPSSAYRSPAGAERDTSSPISKERSWALLSWQPFFIIFPTASNPLLHPAGGKTRGLEEPWCEEKAKERWRFLSRHYSWTWQGKKCS